MRDRCSFYKDQKSFAGITEALYQKHFDKGYSMDLDGFTYTRQLPVALKFTGNNTFLKGKNLKFLDNSFINDHGIKAIELTSGTNMRICQTNPLTDQINQAWLASAYLTIVDDCDMEILKVPLTSLCLATNGNQLAMFNIKNINWGACYVRFTQTQAITSANSLIFNIYQ